MRIMSRMSQSLPWILAGVAIGVLTCGPVCGAHDFKQRKAAVLAQKRAQQQSASRSLPGLVPDNLGGPLPGSLTAMHYAKSHFYPYSLDEAYGPPVHLAHTPEWHFMNYGYYF